MSSTKTAHDLKRHQRTRDVKIDDDVNFDGLLLSGPVLQGLKSAGFERPSPIQLKAIPLGRCGLDLVVQAKSGTGKTCVFSVIALEDVIVDTSATQVLIIAPTREIAVQIWEVISAVGSCLPGLRCYTFIGGLPVAEDTQKLKRCHIAIGTPGRVKQLMELGALRTSSIRLFVLDEADKLMEDGMQEDINWLYSQLPENKQMLALSATYPEVLAEHLTVYMRNPTFIRLNSNDPALLGIRQYYRAVLFHPLPQKSFSNKVVALKELLSQVEFRQCLVFSNYQLRAQSLADQLSNQGWPATYISGSQDQQHRLTAMARLKRFKCRVLVSTDLTSRGIDAEHVNLVVNMDLPPDHETYLHRIGRAGRFGTFGAAVTFVTLGQEINRLKDIEEKCTTTIKVLPAPAPSDLASSSGFINVSHLVSTERIITKNEEGSKHMGHVDRDEATKVTLSGNLEPSGSVICAAEECKETSHGEDSISNSAVNNCTGAGASTKHIPQLSDLKKKTQYSMAKTADFNICLPGNNETTVLPSDNKKALNITSEENSIPSISLESIHSNASRMAEETEAPIMGVSQDLKNTSTFVFKAPQELYSSDQGHHIEPDTSFESIQTVLMSSLKDKCVQKACWSFSDVAENFERYMKDCSDVELPQNTAVSKDLVLIAAQKDERSEQLDNVTGVLKQIMLENEQLLTGKTLPVRGVSQSSPHVHCDFNNHHTGISSDALNHVSRNRSHVVEKLNSVSHLSVQPNVAVHNKKSAGISPSQEHILTLPKVSRSPQYDGADEVSHVSTTYSIDAKPITGDLTVRSNQNPGKKNKKNRKKKEVEDLSLGKEYIQMLRCQDTTSERDSSQMEQSGYISDSEEESSDSDSGSSCFDEATTDGYFPDDEGTQWTEKSKNKYSGLHNRHAGRAASRHSRYPKNDLHDWEKQYTPESADYFGNDECWNSKEYGYGDTEQPSYSHGYEHHYGQQDQYAEPQTEQYHQNYGHFYPSPKGHYDQQAGQDYCIPDRYMTEAQQHAHYFEHSSMNAHYWAGWQSCYASWLAYQTAAGMTDLPSQYKQLYDYHQRQAQLYYQQYKMTLQQKNLARIYQCQKAYIETLAKHARCKLK